MKNPVLAALKSATDSGKCTLTAKFNKIEDTLAQCSSLFEVWSDNIFLKSVHFANAIQVFNKVTSFTNVPFFIHIDEIDKLLEWEPQLAEQSKGCLLFLIHVQITDKYYIIRGCKEIPWLMEDSNIYNEALASEFLLVWKELVALFSWEGLLPFATSVLKWCTMCPHSSSNLQLWSYLTDSTVVSPTLAIHRNIGRVVYLEDQVWKWRSNAKVGTTH